MEKTLNQIIDIFKDFTDTYPLVRTIKFGTAKQLNSFLQNQDETPYIYIQPVTINLSGNLMTYQFKVGCYDSRGKNLDNLIDVWSDTAQILTDYRKWLINTFENNAIWSVNTDSVSLIPLVNSTNDWMSGWEMNINVSTGLIESDCLVPKVTI